MVSRIIGKVLPLDVRIRGCPETTLFGHLNRENSHAYNLTLTTHKLLGFLGSLYSASDPAQVAMGHITGFYEITHIATGKTFKTWHKTTFTRFRAIDACLLVRNAETLVASKGSGAAKLAAIPVGESPTDRRSRDCRSDIQQRERRLTR